MRTITKGKWKHKKKAEGELVHRGGVLQSDEQRPGTPPIPIEFLIFFLRHLIRAHPSQDLYDMAMVAAEREVPLTTKQKAAFKLAVMNEAEQSIWPKGFF